MRYDDPALIDRLAGEYVLGTLHGRARRRFERMMAARPDVQRAVWRWESHLGEIAAPAVDPPPQTWSRIEARLGGASDRTTGFGALRFWRSWGLAATALALVLGTVLVLGPPRGAAPDHVALVGESTEPLWVIGVNLESGELRARAVNARAAELDRSFELWMLPTDGPPQSMGLLPVSGASVERQLPAGLVALLRQSRSLAISIEPPGGSPIGLPTGPVIQTATVVEL